MAGLYDFCPREVKSHGSSWQHEGWQFAFRPEGKVAGIEKGRDFA